MANKVRFTDQLTVNSFGNVMPEAIITASGGVGNIIFTKANGNQVVLPLATTQSSADSLVTASVSNNIITFTKGDLSTFSITVATGSGGGGSVDTGSLLTTGSANLNVLTFLKGDGTSFTLTVDTGSGAISAGTVSSSAQITALGFVTSSSTASFITNSQTSSMSVLSSQTASYVLNAVSSSFSSFALSASYAVSSSHEIIKEISSSYADTASYVENAQSASFVTTAQTASYIQKDNIDGLLISSSAQIASDISGAFGASSASFSTRVSANEVITAKTLISGSAQITELGFVQSSITASSLDTASVSNNTITFTKGNGDTFDITVNTGSGTSIDTGSFITNSQTSSMTVGTASIANFIPFNGNRSVSNQNQPLNIRNVNFGANGLADFINKVYFTNDGPVLDAQNITIGEFLSIGSTVATITATDAEGQAITFGTSSTYTDDFFRIDSSTGVITMNVKSTSSMNTYNDGGTLKAPFPVTATDTFNESGSLTYYIRITPNTAPIWSETSGVGNVTDITQSIAEDSTAGTNKDRYYFRDTEGDTITIGSGSFSPHFTTAFALTLQSGYVRLDQITASLDYDTYPSYSFVLTASDEHYQSGDDPNSITYLPVKINVTDNIAPSINNQPLTGVNEKSNTSAVAGTVFAEDAEGNTITFTQFILKSAFLNSNPTVNLTSSLGGASLQNPSSDPFSINPSTGQVTRKAGQFLNVDIADRYVYTTTVRDNFNPVSASADVTIPIANHVANTISISSVANIIETATAGNTIKRSSTGLGGNNTILSAANNSIQRWEITSTPDLIEATNITASSTTLRLKSDLSGSSTVGGDTITLRITASQDDFDTTIQYLDKVVDVELMTAPVLTPSDFNLGANLNTNGARGSNNLILVSITDPQSFTIDHSTWTFTPNAGQALEAVQNGGANSYYVRPTSNLVAGTYGYTASIFNDKGFRAGELKDEFTIAQAPVGSLTTNGTFYIIESALTNNPVVLDDDGRTGTTGSLGVTYSPEYNSAEVQSFASSNAAIAVASNGNLTAGENVSGSSNTYPGTITSNITWQDQYGNAGGPTTITVNIAENTAPSATITKVSPTLEAPQSAGTKLADVSISDTEGDTPFNLSLTGTDAASLVAFPTNANSSSYEIRLAGNENAAASFTYNAVVKDNFGSTQTYSNQTLSIDAVPVFWYAYLPEVGAYATDVASCLSSYGDANDDGTLDTNMPFYDIANGNLGDTTITSSGLAGVSAEFSFLVASGSAITASRTNLFLDGIDQTVGQQGFTGLIIVFPSGSSGFLQPESMGVTLGDSTSGRYLMFGDMPGTGINDNPRTSAVRYFDFIGGNQYPNSSETRFGTIFLPGESTSNIDYFLMSASGSAPASQQ